MNCYDYESHLSAFVDGDMPSQLRKEFLQHKSNCPQCEEQLREFKRALNSLQSLPKKRVAPNFNQKLYARIKQEEQSSVWSKIQDLIPDLRVPRYVVATAFVLVVATVGFTSLQDNSDTRTPVQKSVVPPPALNVQQPTVTNQAESVSPDDETVPAQDTNRVVSPERKRSYEEQIKYVKSD
ncbi:MAG: zf-HC2 domain-containing protein [Candidatus Marinimicrobia bacterium]|nr:zf-HC2 domain-containing protein [Candidatus Neomarinimicrobiota bacterium]MCF7829821.1 zf-HC2 domain-containing protein [Candidatus Neomarinimicrobiota bacterium]MCF7881746.1 zf-HC2 domain-containing protein [Candidatus Neomarinimicrobiota bacterium]